MRISTVGLVAAILVAAALSASAAVAASPAIPSDCSDGPAHRAGPTRPHTVDPAGDTYYLPDATMDIRAAWIGVEEGVDGQPGYTAHLQMADVDGGGSLPAGFYEVTVLDTVLGAWISTDGTVELGQWAWWLTGPFIDEAGVAKVRAIDGSVDADRGRISLRIPEDVAPAADTTVTTTVRPRTAHGAVVSDTLPTERIVLTRDVTAPDGRCTATLDGLGPQTAGN